MSLPRRHNAAGLLATLLALAPGCISPAFHADNTRTVATTPRAPPEDVETIVSRHRSELEALADLAKVDNIERGGVIIDYNGTTRLVEIHNQFRDGPEFISRYTNGEFGLRDTLADLITSAASARANCNPSAARLFYSRAQLFRDSLAAVQFLLAKNCEGPASQLHIIFTELALHTTYRRDPAIYSALTTQGTVLLHVHTHNDLRTEPDEDTTDYLAPSRQDLIISEDQEGIVSGVNSADEHRIYHSSKGTYRIIKPDSSLALR